MTPEELDRELGDPADPENPYGWAAAVRRDEAGEYPSDFADVLRKHDFHLNYLPASLGGTFESFDRSLTLVRTAARRDLNVMPSTMFSITAATCVRLHGSPAQQERVAEILRRGGSVAFALSEADHGSDLLANEARLTPAAGAADGAAASPAAGYPGGVVAPVHTASAVAEGAASGAPLAADAQSSAAGPAGGASVAAASAPSVQSPVAGSVGGASPAAPVPARSAEPPAAGAVAGGLASPVLGPAVGGPLAADAPSFAAGPPGGAAPDAGAEAPAGWRLDGVKWMVGLGQRSEAAYVVARTGERGPGAFSAVLTDLDGVERGPEVPTGGMRGIDFAHLRFDGHPVAEADLVGRQGEALEAAVKAQQVVRLMSTAGSLGCADTALRLTLDFATERRIGRTQLIDSPYPRRELAIASAALLAADAVALAAARGIHVVPEQFSVWGCAAKHVVAEAVEDVMARCATVLATRSVLRTEGPGGGIFQKLQRDAALVRVVDTSTVANLRSFAGQLPALTQALTTFHADPRAVREIFDLDAELPPFELGRLDLNSRGRDVVTANLPDTGPIHRHLTDLAVQVATADPKGNELVDLAERFAWLHAAAACLHLWVVNRENEVLGRPDWLTAVLAYLLSRAEGTPVRRREAELVPALATVRDLHGRHRMFSAAPVRLT
ncbi:acyl-CoA dehydrogenase family protein [Kitasatospora sp. NPDC096147]|uniref:acyl-CoA dehydrogenase family protein n=1 Tax=Kitasatospora sp. NPDC096147 TaxID=3364093 RepID=UPI0037F73AFF